MISEEDVYIQYRHAKSLQSGKGYRLPKQWDEYFTTKMTAKNREYLTRATGHFNTTWSNIDVATYMECGCELYKTFSYHMFLKPQILTHYIEKDKQKKRRIKVNHDSIDDSIDYINDFLSSNMTIGVYPPDYTDLQIYCKIKNDNQKQIVSDYLKNKIDPLLLAYCLYYKYLKLTDIEREYCYNVINRYRDILEHVFEVESHIQMREGK